MYSTLFPCCECAKVIIQSGIKCVIFASDKNREQDVFKASKRMFELAKVEMRAFAPETEDGQRETQRGFLARPRPPCGLRHDVTRPDGGLKLRG